MVRWIRVSPERDLVSCKAGRSSSLAHAPAALADEPSLNARKIALNFAAAFLLLATSVSLTPQQRAEVKRLDDSLLAPCCYTQPISQHLSDAAEEMRQQVDEMVASGMGDREIIEHYRQEYGDRILVVPDGNTGQVLFAIPAVLFFASSGILFFFLRRLQGE